MLLIRSSHSRGGSYIRVVTLECVTTSVLKENLNDQTKISYYFNQVHELVGVGKDWKACTCVKDLISMGR